MTKHDKKILLSQNTKNIRLTFCRSIILKQGLLRSKNRKLCKNDCACASGKLYIVLLFVKGNAKNVVLVLLLLLLLLLNGTQYAMLK